MWLKKVMHNKKQYILLGMALLVISIIVTLAVDFTLELKVFSSICINEENSADVMAIAIGTDELDIILDEEDKSNVENTLLMEGKVVSVSILAGKSDVSQFYQMMLFMDGEENKYFYLEEDNSDTSLKSGEVWISKTIAKSNNIEVGDSIVLSYDDPVELRVSGIYNSSLTATASLCVTPILLSEEDKDHFDEVPGALLAMDLYDKSIGETMFSDNEYIMTSYSREILQNKFTQISDLLGIVGGLAAVIVFIVALFVVSFIVKNDINRQIKEIGIYKCLGYKNRRIIGFYMIGYLVDGILMTSIGAVISLPLVRYMGNLCTEYVGDFKLTKVSFYCCIAVVCSMNLLLVFNLGTALRKIHKITPVEAFTVGQTSSIKRLPQSKIKNAVNSFQVAINDIFRYKNRSIMITLVFSICLLLSFLFVKIAYSSSIMTENPNLWFAVPRNNCYMFGNIESDVVDWLNEQEEVAYYSYGDLNYVLPVEVNDVKVEGCQITFDIFNNVSEELTGILIDGKTPTKNEVVLSNNLLNVLGCSVGDTINLSAEERAAEFKISGTYTSMLSSYGIMISVEGIKQLKEDYISSMAFITLNNEEDFKVFSNNINDKWNNMTADKEWFAMNNALSSVKIILFNISCILIFVFVMLSIMIVTIILMIENSNKRKQFGVMKAMGFHNSYMIQQNLFIYGILGILGLIIALVIHILFSDKLLTMVLINAFEDSVLIMTGLSVGFMLLLIVMVYVLCSRIKKVKPIELMED